MGSIWGRSSSDRVAIIGIVLGPEYCVSRRPKMLIEPAEAHECEANVRSIHLRPSNHVNATRRGICARMRRFGAYEKFVQPHALMADLTVKQAHTSGRVERCRSSSLSVASRVRISGAEQRG